MLTKAKPQSVISTKMEVFLNPRKLEPTKINESTVYEMDTLNIAILVCFAEPEICYLQVDIFQLVAMSCTHCCGYLLSSF